MYSTAILVRVQYFVLYPHDPYSCLNKSVLLVPCSRKAFQTCTVVAEEYSTITVCGYDECRALIMSRIRAFCILRSTSTSVLEFSYTHDYEYTCSILTFDQEVSSVIVVVHQYFVLLVRILAPFMLVR